MFWSPSKTDAKTCSVGASSASVLALTTKLVFSRQTSPIHTTTPKNQEWVCIAYFGHLQKVRENAPRWRIQRTRSRADYETRVFAQTCRIPSIHVRTKLRFCLMFWLASKTGLKTCPVGAFNASVRASITKLVFSRQTCPTHSFTSKNQIWVCISSFARLQKPTRKRAPLVHQMPRFLR